MRNVTGNFTGIALEKLGFPPCVDGAANTCIIMQCAPNVVGVRWANNLLSLSLSAKEPSLRPCLIH